jgi:asparagine synthase (glutamine-hydrolysing)
MEFVVLPDLPAAGPLSAAFAGDRMRTISHPSGRPWIVGHWDDSECVTVTVGDRRIVLLGRVGVDIESLRSRARRVGTDSDLDNWATELSGNLYLLCSAGGRARAQGSLSGIYRLYYATVDGVTVVADRPDRLVGWTEASLDAEQVALQLLGAYDPPWPLNFSSMWRGIRSVLPGECIHLDPAGAAGTRQWWCPPAPEVPLAEVVDPLREALLEAVAARTGPDRSVRLSLDLSGGMDSTGLCYLAHHQEIPLITFHCEALDPSDPATVWTERCLRDLRPERHFSFSTRSLPGVHDDEVLSPQQAGLEGPPYAVKYVEFLAGAVAGAGSARHLQGIGADELFHPSGMWLNAQFRRRPWRYRHALRGARAKGRWGVGTTLRNVRRPSSYQRWFARAAHRVSPVVGGQVVQDRAGWEMPVFLPEWVTPEAETVVRRRLLEVARQGVAPMVDQPVAHEMLRRVHSGAAFVRQCLRTGERLGVAFEAPYIDNRIIQLALSVRFEDRKLPGFNKTVLAHALDGIMPRDVIERRDKSVPDRDVLDSVRRSRRKVAELCVDPVLADLGLVRPEAMRQVALGLHVNPQRQDLLGPTLALERWLRSLPSAQRPTSAELRQPARPRGGIE